MQNPSSYSIFHFITIYAIPKWKVSACVMWGNFAHFPSPRKKQMKCLCNSLDFLLNLFQAITLWSASQLVQLILMCVSTVTQGNQRMTTTWVSCSPRFSAEFCFIVWLRWYLYWLLSATEDGGFVEGRCFLMENFSHLSAKHSALSCSSFLFMPPLIQSLGGS